MQYGLQRGTFTKRLQTLNQVYTLPQKVQTHKYTVRGESRAKKVIVGAIYESATVYTVNSAHLV